DTTIQSSSATGRILASAAEIPRASAAKIHRFTRPASGAEVTCLFLRADKPDGHSHTARIAVRVSVHEIEDPIEVDDSDGIGGPVFGQSLVVGMDVGKDRAIDDRAAAVDIDQAL